MRLPTPPPAGQKGMVLIMTLLMTTVLTLLASAAVMRTAANLKDGSADRIGEAAFRISEAGTLATIGLAAQMQAGFRDYVTEKAGALTMADMGDAVLDLSPTGGSFGSELATVGNLDFASLVTTTDQASAVAGFDASRYCFTTFRIVTTAQVGTASPTTLQEVAVSGQTAIAANVTVGPSLCGQ